MKTTLLILLLAGVATFAQSGRVPTEEEAWRYFEAAQPGSITWYTYYEGEELYELYARRDPGDVIIMGTNLYRVKEFKDLNLFECRVLELHGDRLTAGEMEGYAARITKACEEGIPFEDLIAQYAHNSPETQTEELNDDYLPVAMATGEAGMLFVVTEENHSKMRFIMVKQYKGSKRAVKVQFVEYKS